MADQLSFDLLLSLPEPERPSEASPPPTERAEEEARRLASRLRAQGLPLAVPVRVHANRSVVLGYHPRKGLRIHRGYAYAPDDVLRAVVRSLKPGLRRHERLEVQRAFLEFPVHRHVPPERASRRAAEREHAGDVPILERLQDLHSRLNARRFDGVLQPIRFRLSGRMRSRLGELAVDSVTGEAIIGISRLHLKRDGWAAVEHTVLHEMVHQWQVESGHPLDHGPVFRKKAEEVGIDGSAVWRPGKPLVAARHRE